MFVGIKYRVTSLKIYNYEENVFGYDTCMYDDGVM